MMQAVAKGYYDSISNLKEGNIPPNAVTMVSTVTEEWVRNEDLRNPQYWVDNTISSVRFSPVVENMTFDSRRKIWKRLDCSHRSKPRVTFMLEVGFHGALKGPLRDILTSFGSDSVGYAPMLLRDKAPFNTLFDSLGQLFCHGCPVTLEAVNATDNKTGTVPELLCNLPEYSFNRTKSYWEEWRISKRYRLHSQIKLDS
jgi:acyl transferase domain-containing protein